MEKVRDATGADRPDMLHTVWQNTAPMCAETRVANTCPNSYSFLWPDFQ